MTSKRNEKCFVLMPVLAVLLLTLVGSVHAAWTFDPCSSSFVIEPSLCTPDVFEYRWSEEDPCYAGTSGDPQAYIYDHNMFFKDRSWYDSNTGRSNMTSYNEPDPCKVGYDPTNTPFDPNFPRYADIRFQGAMAGGDLVELETTIWHNCHNEQLSADHYLSYSVDGGQNYTNYFLNENWNLGTPAGSGYGNANHSDTASAQLSGAADDVLVRYGIDELLYEDFTNGTDYPWHSWDEWYGLGWKVWGKSNETEFHDNYITNPFDETNGPSTIYSSTTTSWLTHNSGSLANNYSSRASSVIYMVASRNPILGMDVRLKSTDLSDTSEAIFCNGTTTRLHLAISMSPDGPWFDIYSTTQWKGNLHNPGNYIDLSMSMPEVVYVSIYSTDDAFPEGGEGANYYIRWGGFHVELDTIPYNCAAVRDLGLGYAADIDQDCDVDMLDLAQFSSAWLSCNDPEGDPAQCQGPQ